MKAKLAQEPVYSAVHMVPLGETLPLGTILRDYAVIDVLGHGGFGVVYLALDVHLNREVAIKEFLPQGLAMRLPNADVGLIPGGNLARFESGMAAFLNEAKLPARFDDPALPRVHAYWEEKGTAYVAMPHYPGTTLAQTLQAMQHPPDEVWLRAFFSPLLRALSSLHAQHCYHRDISPENILVMPDGSPMLLDFGAATQLAGGKTLPLGAMLNSLYAPIEQYSETKTLPQGPWTDLYALAGVMRFAITGQAPMPATVRAVKDQQPALAAAVQERTRSGSRWPLYTPSFLRAIDSALAVHPEERPQNAHEFQSAWDTAVPTVEDAVEPGSGVSSRTARPRSDPNHHVAEQPNLAYGVPRTRTASASASTQSKLWKWVWAVTTVLFLAIAAAAWWVQSQPSQKSLLGAERAATPTLATALPNGVPARDQTASLVQPPAQIPTATPSTPDAIAAVSNPPPAEDSSRATATTPPSQTNTDAVTPPPDAENKSVKSNKSSQTDTGTNDRQTKNLNTSPRTLCGTRSNFSLLYCMEKQCAQSKFSKHPQCLELKANGELQ